jgi:hypothetical protein
LSFFHARASAARRFAHFEQERFMRWTILAVLAGLAALAIFGSPTP